MQMSAEEVAAMFGDLDDLEEPEYTDEDAYKSCTSKTTSPELTDAAEGAVQHSV